MFLTLQRWRCTYRELTLNSDNEIDTRTVCELPLRRRTIWAVVLRSSCDQLAPRLLPTASTGRRHAALAASSVGALWSAPCHGVRLLAFQGCVSDGRSSRSLRPAGYYNQPVTTCPYSTPSEHGGMGVKRRGPSHIRYLCVSGPLGVNFISFHGAPDR